MHDRETALHPLFRLPQLAHELAFQILVAAPLAILGVLRPDRGGEGPADA